ncbi:phospholipase D-like domain-containing protein [Mycetocola sp. 2940]|uniref:phospholipase D-like domain-containing protein n=1 Tax=Mycetocola sp. 2940 TaxID=3156452 RepID=UPI0033936BD5
MYPIGALGGTALLVADEEYPLRVREMLGGAGQRCLVSMFIVDAGSRSEAVNDIVLALEAALWRGLDVRIVLGGSRTNQRIAEATAGAAQVFHDRSIPVRWLAAQPRRGSHAKLVIADDSVLVGSHNWSAGAFSGQHQDSVRFDSPALASYFTAHFNAQWIRAGAP